MRGDEVTSSAVPPVQLRPQLSTDWLQMHEITEARPRAFSGLVLSELQPSVDKYRTEGHHPSLPAASFSEVGDWCELGVDGPPTEPTVVQILHGLVGVLLLLELDVDIADQMISQVVTDVHLLHWAVFVLTFYEHVFEEVIIMFLQRICI